MQRFYIYLTDKLKNEIAITAKVKGKSKAEVTREALEKGLQATQTKSISAQALLELAKMAEKIPTKGKVPKDLVKNLDYYTWGGKKRE